MTSSYDVVVVGAGHNGLVAAGYLARAGLHTLVLERREQLGGSIRTVELARGARVPELAHTVGRLRPSVVRDLELRRHGLAFVAPDVRVFAPRPDGGAVTLFADPARTADGLRAMSASDADAYVGFDRLVRSLGRFLAELGSQPPPDIDAPSLGDALAGLRLGRTFRGLGPSDARTILRVLPMAVADFVAEAFQTEPLRAAIAWRGVRHAFLGPWSGGSTSVLLHDGAGNDGGAAGETVYAKGGPGAVTDALASAVRAAGGEVRTSSEVTAVTSAEGRATGVIVGDGEEIEARAIVAGIDPKRLLTGLVDPVAIGPTVRWRASNIRTPGAVGKVNLVLRGLPSFRAADGQDARLLRGRVLVGAGSIDELERAFDEAKYGRIPELPPVEATIPSLADPSLVAGAPEGTQVMSVQVQYVPYALRGAAWDECREALGDRVLAALETVAPGIGGLVEARQVMTPLDLERDHGLTGGHPFHAEPTLDSFFLWRPLLGYARYRMPLDGLFLAGSGAHPGGGVTGGPGQNAAREIVGELKRRRR